MSTGREWYDIRKQRIAEQLRSLKVVMKVVALFEAEQIPLREDGSTEKVVGYCRRGYTTTNSREAIVVDVHSNTVPWTLLRSCRTLGCEEWIELKH